jgi:long-chain acyl-CoA synthetase
MPASTDSFVDDMVANVALQFLERVNRSPRAEAFRYVEGEDWVSVTWAECGLQVARLAAGLLSLGLEPEQRVGIASATRYEWILADLAVMCAGGATTTVYPSTNAEDTAYVLRDSDCRVVFAEDDEQVAKLQEARPELPQLTKVVTFDGRTDGGWVMGLEELAGLGDTYLADHPGVIEETAAGIGPDRHRGSSTRVTSSSAGCRWPTPSGRCCSRPSSPAAMRPPSTGGSTGSSTTWAW